MNTKSQFDFDVFISYSRKDIDFARLLEKALRNYRPPKEFGDQRRALRVFRDESDLFGNDLAKALRSNLARASKLLVICSPASRASEYVGLEIKAFAALRGAEHIFAVLYRAASAGNGGVEDKPESLYHPEFAALFDSPFGVDYCGFDPAKQKPDKGAFQPPWFALLAQLYGRDKSEVERRERKKQAARRLFWIELLASFAFCMAMLAVWALLERHNAVQQSRVALSRQLAAQSIEMSSRSLDLSLLLSLQAVHTDDSRETENALARNLHLHGELMKFLSAHNDTVWSVSFSADGERIATGSQDRRVIVWNAKTGEPAGQSWSFSKAVRGVTLCADGRTLAVGDESGDVSVENLNTGQGFVFPKQPAVVLGVACSPDGRRVASVNSIGQLFVWDIGASHSKLPVLNIDLSPGQTIEARSVAISPDGSRLAATTADGFVALFDAQSGDLRNTWRAHPGGAQGVAFSPDGRTLATSGDNGEVTLWRTENATPLKTFPPHRGKVYAVSFVQGGKLLASAGEDQMITLDDIESGKETFRVSAHEGAIYALGANREGTVLGSTSFDRRLILWNVAEDAPKLLLGPQSASVRDVAFRPDGKEMATVNWAGELILWDTRTGAVKDVIVPHGGAPAYRAVYSPDGKWLATAGGDNQVVLWDAYTHVPSRTLAWHKRAVRSLAFSPDNQYLASGDRDGKIALWSVETGRMIEEMKGHDIDTAVYCLAFSPDSKTVASAGFDQRVILHEVRQGVQLAEHRLHQEAVRAVTFSPDGSIIASGGVDGWVILWNVARDEKQKLFHGAGVGDLAYSPDGKTLVSVGDDRNVALWDTRTNKMTVQLKGHEAKIQAVAFDPRNPLRIATAARDKTIRIWNIDPAQWRRDACDIANRNLTCGEWSAFVGEDAPYQRTCGDKPLPADRDAKTGQCDFAAIATKIRPEDSGE